MTPIAAIIPSSGTPLTGTSSTGTPQIAPTGIGNDSSRLKSNDNLAKAGEKFEAIFTGMMLKSMRQAKLSDPLFDSKAIDTFSEMQDGEVAKAMASHTPLGIGKAMTDFLSKSQPDLNQATSDPPK